MRRATVSVLLLAALAGPAPLVAGIDGLEVVPAATLLLPYFEVDLDHPLGRTTLFSVTNAGQEATLAHLTLWTDLGVPTLGFDIYLTGWDIQTFNLRDLFVAGTIPATAPAGEDPGDSTSPQGDFSLDSSFAGCQGQLPEPPLGQPLLAHLRAAHTGEASGLLQSRCAGVDFGDNVARGYITVDQVESCNLGPPTEASYYSSGIGFRNTLVGDYFYVDADQNFAQGETMVHIEADPSLGADHYTFYRAWSGGADRREGLANVFFVRYIAGGLFDGGTDLIVWRDSKREVEPFDCALAFPQPFPLGQSQLLSFDEEENPDDPAFCPFTCPPGPRPFPFQTNRVEVNGADLITPFSFGAWYFSLNTEVTGSLVPFEPLSQAFVSVVMSAEQRFSVGFDAYQLGYVTVPEEAVEGYLPVCDGAPDPPACGS